jgi:hypothetical protein
MASNRDFAWKRKAAMLMRWLHIYLSMLSFAIIFFFAVTGLTLNHADKFGSQLNTTHEKGRLDSNWVSAKDTAQIEKLRIVEFLRDTYRIHAALSDFRIDDDQIGVSFKGPGYEADAFIVRPTGKLELTETSAGFVGLINDLHKGRDTGHGWSVFIDVSAILLTMVSLTGMILILFLKKRRAAGLTVAVFGLAVAWLIYKIWIK